MPTKSISHLIILNNIHEKFQSVDWLIARHLTPNRVQESEITQKVEIVQ